MSILKEKREERKKATAEYFTPSWLVNQMLSKLSHYAKDIFQDPNKTFLDPACGNGNIIIHILKQKLDNGNNPIQALSSIFGTDIMSDNIQECRLRLLKVIHQKSIKLTIEHIKLVKKNIVCTPLSKYPNGSLDYLDLDESKTFNDNISDEQANKALIKILNENRLDNVSIIDDPIHSTTTKQPKKKNFLT